jgi:hypothetical protein
MHEWDTFAVVVGGSAGALVGLLFVAISIHPGRIAESKDLRGRAAQTLVIFAALRLIGLLRSIPVQPDWVLGIELLVLAVFVAIALIALDHLAQQSDSPRAVAGTVKAVNPHSRRQSTNPGLIMYRLVHYRWTWSLPTTTPA